MNTLENYASDEEIQTSNSHFSQSSGKCKAVEQDVNYDNITMDMSEDSSHHEPSSSRSESSDSRSSSSSFDEYYDKKIRRKNSYSRSDDRSQHSDSPDYNKGGNRDSEKRRKHGRDEKDHRERDEKDHRERDEKDHRERDERDHRDRDERDHRDREDKKSYHRHSRSPSYHRYDRSRKSRSRSPRDRGRHSRRDYHSPPRRRRDYYDRSRGLGGGPCDRKPSKLSILEKLGIELKLPETDNDGTPLALPSYYNPVAMNPAKYAQQIAKRKLLWGNSSNKQKPSGEKIEPTDSKTNSVWQGARFSQDQDGKLTAKFQRLMGIKKESNGDGDSSTSSQERPEKDLLKKQEELFSSMELQYEVARQATHTQRGVGLGFGAHHFTK